MKPLLILANWKSNKNFKEANEWLNLFRKNSAKLNLENKEIVICPPYVVLYIFNEFKNKPHFRLGAQDISQFSKGQFTGEVNGELLKEFVSYVIIGHSERRKIFNESNKLIEEKLKNALTNDLVPVYCAQGENVAIPKGVRIVAYEPTFAIGTGNPDSPENANLVAGNIKRKYGVEKVLYGGSVSKENVKSFTRMTNIDGVLVGNSSLNPLEFIEIINNA